MLFIVFQNVVFEYNDKNSNENNNIKHLHSVKVLKTFRNVLTY